MSKDRTFPHGIDITAPGGITALLEHHRKFWGDAQMNADGGTGGGEGGDTGSADGGAGNGNDASGQGSTGGDGGTAGTNNAGASTGGTPPWGDGEFDADKAWTLIQNVRGDLATTKANQQQAIDDAVTAATTAATQNLTQTLGKALGLVDDDSKDPAKLLETVTAERDTTAQTLAERDAALKTSQIDLAVYRTAPKHNGNADALLDSRAFMNSVSALDPAANDFSAQVAAAITQAVDSNPALKQVQAAQRMGGENDGGNNTGSNQLTREEFLALSPQAKLDAAKAGRLKNLNP